MNIHNTADSGSGTSTCEFELKFEIVKSPNPIVNRKLTPKFSMATDGKTIAFRKLSFYSNLNDIEIVEEISFVGSKIIITEKSLKQYL